MAYSEDLRKRVVAFVREGGQAGGEILAEGTPFQVASASKSLTGHYLHAHLHR